jgi:hypothetical protein
LQDLFLLRKSLTINDLRRLARRNPLAIKDLWSLIVKPIQWLEIGNPKPPLDLRSHETDKGEAIGVYGIAFP